MLEFCPCGHRDAFQVGLLLTESPLVTNFALVDVHFLVVTRFTTRPKSPYNILSVGLEDLYKQGIEVVLSDGKLAR